MKKKLFFTLFLLATLTSLAGWAILTYSYSNGVRTGKLVKLSKKGMFIKTYEGTLDLGSGDLLTWNFSVHDKELGESLVKKSGQTVRLYYDELLWKVFYDSKYNVKKYSVVESEGGLDLLCRLVNIMRKSKTMVDLGRQLIQQHDADLLRYVRKCQN